MKREKRYLEIPLRYRGRKHHALVLSVGVSFCWREQVARATIAGTVAHLFGQRKFVELGLHLSSYCRLNMVFVWIRFGWLQKLGCSSV